MIQTATVHLFEGNDACIHLSISTIKLWKSCGLEDDHLVRQRGAACMQLNCLSYLPMSLCLSTPTGGWGVVRGC